MSYNYTSPDSGKSVPIDSTELPPTTLHHHQARKKLYPWPHTEQSQAPRHDPARQPKSKPKRSAWHHFHTNWVATDVATIAKGGPRLNLLRTAPPTAQIEPGSTHIRVTAVLLPAHARKDRGEQRAAVVERSVNFRANSCADRSAASSVSSHRAAPAPTPKPTALPGDGPRVHRHQPSPPMVRLPGMLRVQPRPYGDGATSPFVQSRLERVPSLDASGAAASGRLLPARTATRAYLDAHAYLEDNQPL